MATHFGYLDDNWRNHFKTMDSWRNFFKTAPNDSDIFEVIKYGIYVAELDWPIKFKTQRDDIAELLGFNTNSIVSSVSDRDDDDDDDDNENCTDDQYESDDDYENIKDEHSIVGEIKDQLLLHLSNYNDDKPDGILLKSLRRLQLMELSFETLKDTEIGKVVNSLRKKDKSKQISNICRTLIIGWRKVVDEWIEATPTIISDCVIDSTNKTSSVFDKESVSNCQNHLEYDKKGFPNITELSQPQPQPQPKNVDERKDSSYKKNVDQDHGHEKNMKRAITASNNESLNIIGEVLRIKEHLLLSSNKDESNDGMLLESLKKLQLMAITVQILQDTEIGKIINSLPKKHKSEQIRNISRTLIIKWRKVVDDWIKVTPSTITVGDTHEQPFVLKIQPPNDHKNVLTNNKENNNGQHNRMTTIQEPAVIRPSKNDDSTMPSLGHQPTNDKKKPREGPNTFRIQNNSTFVQQDKSKNSDEDAALLQKFESTKRKFIEGLQHDKNVKKQRGIKTLKLHEIPTNALGHPIIQETHESRNQRRFNGRRFAY